MKVRLLTLEEKQAMLFSPDYPPQKPDFLQDADVPHRLRGHYAFSIVRCEEEGITCHYGHEMHWQHPLRFYSQYCIAPDELIFEIRGLICLSLCGQLKSAVYEITETDDEITPAIRAQLITILNEWADEDALPRTVKEIVQNPQGKRHDTEQAKQKQPGVSRRGQNKFARKK